MGISMSPTTSEKPTTLKSRHEALLWEAQTKTVGGIAGIRVQGHRVRGRERGEKGRRLVCPSYMDGSQPVWGITDKFSEISCPPLD